MQEITEPHTPDWHDMPDESDVRRLLPHAWHAFFGRFGRLRDIQLAAAEPVVEGRDVLVGAPTASGKTEALIAPLVERVFRSIETSDLRRADAALRLMVVTPTRALCRDLSRRLERPLRDCGLEVDVKTGDAPPVDIQNDPPDLLVTTPESFDSLLTRHPRALRDLVGVVLDELHLIDGTSRGDQLRALVSRLRRVVRDRTQFCGASATLPDGPELARRYLGPDAEFVQRGADGDADHRAVDAELVEAPTLEHAAEAVTELFQRGDGRKLLVFANSRSQVEDLTGMLADREPLRDRVYAHHGSLSRSERLRAEDRLQEAPAAVCVASMTLEVGIDIGDVDRAVLLGPPPNVSSLLQRIGRSNRDDEVTRVTCLYDGEFEQLRFSHLLECAAVGELFEDDVDFRPSVVAQQALSLLFQNPDRWIGPEPLWDRLPEEASRTWDVHDCEMLLAHLGTEDLLHPMEGDRYAPDQSALDMFEYGRVHTNIEDDDEVEVVDALTQQVVGRVRFRESQREKLRSGEDLALSLGGEKRKVVSYTDDQLMVRSEDGLEEAQFIATLPPRYSRDLAADFADYLGVRRDTMLLERVGDHWILFHFLGTIWGRLLEYMLRHRGFVKKRGSHGAFFFELRKPLESIDEAFGDRNAVASAADDAVAHDLEDFVGLLGGGPFADLVPLSQLRRWVESSLELESFVDRIADTDVEEGTLGDDAD